MVGKYMERAVKQRYANNFGRLDVGLSLAAEDNARALNADGSYVNLSFGNWVLGASAIDWNWSDSPNTSIILSANSRPMPTGYLRKNLNQSTSPLLSWIDAWGVEFFLGEVNDKNFMGTRLELVPLTGLKVELLQTVQFSDSLGSIGRALLGNTNEGPGEEINKMAGIGISYARNANRL